MCIRDRINILYFDCFLGLTEIQKTTNPEKDCTDQEVAILKKYVLPIQEKLFRTRIEKHEVEGIWDSIGKYASECFLFEDVKYKSVENDIPMYKKQHICENYLNHVPLVLGNILKWAIENPGEYRSKSKNWKNILHFYLSMAVDTADQSCFGFNIDWPQGYFAKGFEACIKAIKILPKKVEALKKAKREVIEVLTEMTTSFAFDCKRD
eukprot:TRINITY_DN4656_c0_g1_i4.p1 TRINITY_DN4656_c0_g1~~TRINITY_DN4656_c0_g1_i4.p1  ORF type:complete len:227 (-),score=33.68 TRINITY_DN4656_c0_g1_i4:16-639(-)